MIMTTTTSTTICLRVDVSGRLLIVHDGAETPVRLQQCFPWSAPHAYLSLRDAGDRELALVEQPASLGPASREALEQALAAAGFVFDVTRIISIDEEIEIRQWA